MSGPTRASLIAQIQEMAQAHDKQVAALTRDRDDWKAVAPSDKEAHAIAACVLALSKLTRETSSYSSTKATDVDAVGRVLGYLASRFGAFQ